MKTTRSIFCHLAINIVGVSMLAIQGAAADTNGTPAKTIGNQTIVEATKPGTTNAPSASPEMRTQLSPEFGQRLKAVGLRPSDLDSTIGESRLKPEFTGPFPNLVRGNFAKLMDSINPFGHEVPPQARPNSFLIMGDVPSVAGWRNEVSHEPVGISVIGFGR